MTKSEREGLWRTMAQIFDNNIEPYVAAWQSAHK
jgi:hypothetical protein